MTDNLYLMVSDKITECLTRIISGKENDLRTAAKKIVVYERLLARADTNLLWDAICRCNSMNRSRGKAAALGLVLIKKERKKEEK